MEVKIFLDQKAPLYGPQGSYDAENSVPDTKGGFPDLILPMAFQEIPSLPEKRL